MKQTLLATLIVASLLMSCGKDENTDTQPAFKLFVGVSETDKTSYLPSYTSWKDGIASSFNGGTVVDMVVDGNDVYATGFSDNSVTNKTYVMVWKNGKADTIGTSDIYMTSSAIYVSNHDVYVVGRESGLSTNATGKLWKNGVLTTLSKGDYNYIPNDLVVVGNDIYITGYISQGGGVSGAMLWHNGEVTTLGGRSSEGISVFVSGTDVYVGGYVDKDFVGQVATLWKNGKEITLGKGADYEMVNDVFVNGKDVYAGGYTLKNQNIRGMIWKNGIDSAIAYDKRFSGVSRIFVKDGDEYVLGNLGDTAILWKNGVPKKLTDGTKKAAGVGLFVN